MRRPRLSLRLYLSTALATLAAVCGGCHTDLYDQPRIEPYEPSAMFPHQQSARPLIEGTVARGHLREDDAFYTGRENREFVREFPLEVDRALLERGRQQYEIYCSVCHAPTGTGNGMIVQRGFKRPPSLHIDRLRESPHGHFYDVITHGFGAMPRYAPQIEPRDRWAIVAYVRVLQLSRHAALDDVPAEARAQLEEAR